MTGDEHVPEEEVDGRVVEAADPAGTRPKVDRDALLPSRARLGAGEPPPPGEGPGTALDVPDEEDGGGVLAAPLARHEAPHAPRFHFLLGALLAIGVLAVVGLVWAVTEGGTRDEGPTWSAWRPAGTGVAAAQQIADHVAPLYKNASGAQLAHVAASELEISDVRLDLVQREPAEQGGDVAPLEGDAMSFEMCGLGDDCAIPGKPSEARGLLLRREALEIAGYAFRYLGGLDYTVFFLPPGPATVPASGASPERTVTLKNQVLVFRRDDLEPMLDAPLRMTLTAPPPPIERIHRSPERPLIDALATQARFFFSLSQGAAEDHAFLVLDRSPQPAQIQDAIAEADVRAAAEKQKRGAVRKARLALSKDRPRAARPRARGD